MTAKFKNAWGYQGDAMNLPVENVDTSAEYYQRTFGFRIESRRNDPHRSVVLERDGVRMALAENGGDPSQDGCAFEIEGLSAVFEELKANGWTSAIDGFDVETQKDGSRWNVFYVVAPDGLCFWFGERLARD